MSTSTGTYRLARAPGGLPLVGNAWPLLRDPLAFLTGLHDRGDLIVLRLGSTLAYLPLHPELVHEVLAHPRIYDKGGELADQARKFMGNSLGTCTWSDHRRQRPMLQAAFRKPDLIEYSTVMTEEAGKLSRSLTDGQTFDVNATMNVLISKILVRTMFCQDIDDATAREIDHCLSTILRGAYLRSVYPALDKLPHPGSRAFHDAIRRLWAFIDTAVTHYRQNPAGRGVLPLLIRADDQGHLPPGELRDQLAIMLLAGSETTSTCLAWTFDLLGRHPRIRRRLQHEARDILDNRAATAADVPALDYTRRVVTESLRMYPPAWMLPRLTTCDTELGGHPIPRGTTVLHSHYAQHHNPAVFTAPHTFDPERWATGKPACPGAFIPFSSGSRKCIGDTFAMNEATIIVATLASRWTFTPTTARPPRPRPQANLGTGPLPMTATRNPERR
ncbi:cytochrome P450 [Streptomyces sp. NPDC020379]|uniref:cytochrome P450 n=1 Tax=Streptomyces sp. NPDC020379 TaxID=3365071 RepID=UPI0037B3388F